MTDRRPTSEQERLATLALLDEPTRRKLYDYVGRSPEPVSRDEAAEAVGVDRSVAAYHLDKLVEEGLLAASFFRPEGRAGPGAGRPAKHYERTDFEVTASVPARRYHLLADILASALEASEIPAALTEALETAAASAGRDLAHREQPTGLPEILEAAGFEPYSQGDTIRLRNCPFNRLARQHADLVCGLNLSLLQAALDELGDVGLRAELDPDPDRCCVTFRPVAGGVGE